MTDYFNFLLQKWTNVVFIFFILFNVLLIDVINVAAIGDKKINGDNKQLIVSRRREPNNVQCFKNSDCLSDCCISNNGWVGICVGKPQIGQICGLFTTANSAPNPNNPWSYGNNGGAWSYGGILGGLLMNGGQGGPPSNGASSIQQSPPNSRQGSNSNGAWVADLNALLGTNGQSNGGGRDPYDASAMMQAYHQGGGHKGSNNGGMDYNSGGGGSYGHGGGGHHGTNGYNMQNQNFDLSSLKYGNKFGKRNDYDYNAYG